MREAFQPAQIEAAQDGSEADLAAVIARYMPLIRRWAHRVTGPGLDFDDAVQEGIIGLFSAIKNYREGGRASFATYASVCVQNAMLSAKKTSQRKKHTPLNQSVPLPEQHSIPGPEEQTVAREQVDQTLEKARAMLSGMEMRVLRLYLDGAGYRQIAQHMGIGEKAVENALARVRRKLR
jgi:RNA polymerase sporulation-specific sigma factor